MDGTGLLNGPAVLEPPLERVRDGQIPELRRSAENFIRENTRCDFVERKHSFREKREEIVAIRLVVQEAKQSRCCLKISSPLFLDEDCVKDVQSRRARHCVVRLFVNKNQQRITQPINFLPCAFEWAGRLGLPDAGNFDVNIQAWKINPLGRTTPRISVTIQQIRLEFVFEISADGFSVRDPEQAGLSVRRFRDGKRMSLLLEIGNG